jgi:hypothetical protein
VSTLWTPGGERPVPRPGAEDTGPPGGGAQPTGRDEEGLRGEGRASPLSEEEAAARLDELRRQLAETPVEDVVANHCYGLFELAALHLSLDPPRLAQARTAIDALGCLVEGMSSRLGGNEPNLREGLAQIRMAYVQIEGAKASEDRAAPPNGSLQDDGPDS